MTIKNICTNCQVVEDDRIFTIFSYGTPVYRVIRGPHGEPLKGTGRLWSGWSATTQKHINKAFEHIGGVKINKKMWLKMPIEK